MIKLIDAICFCGIPDHDLPSPISQVADFSFCQASEEASGIRER